MNPMAIRMSDNRPQRWTVLLVALSAIACMLASCNSQEPLQVSAPIAPAGQNVTLEQRVKFAKHLGEQFQRKYPDGSVTAEGSGGTTLKLQWTGVDRPLASSFVKNEGMITDLREMGFKRLIVTDGYRSTWNVDLKN